MSDTATIDLTADSSPPTPAPAPAPVSVPMDLAASSSAALSSPSKKRHYASDVSSEAKDETAKKLKIPKKSNFLGSKLVSTKRDEKEKDGKEEKNSSSEGKEKAKKAKSNASASDKGKEKEKKVKKEKKEKEKDKDKASDSDDDDAPLSKQGKSEKTKEKKEKKEKNKESNKGKNKGKKSSKGEEKEKEKDKQDKVKSKGNNGSSKGVKKTLTQTLLFPFDLKLTPITPAPDTPYAPQLSVLYTCFEIPMISHFLFLFQRFFHLKRLGTALAIRPEELEHCLIDPPNSQLFKEILSRILLRDSKTRKFLQRGDSFSYDLLINILKLQFQQFWMDYQREKQRKNSGGNGNGNAGEKEMENGNDMEDEESGAGRRGRREDSESDSEDNDNGGEIDDAESAEEEERVIELLKSSSHSSFYAGPDFDAQFNGKNPLESSDYHALPVDIRARILSSLCQFQLFTCQELQLELRSEIEPKYLRISPLGSDSLGNRYFYFSFADYRIYRENAPAKTQRAFEKDKEKEKEKEEKSKAKGDKKSGVKRDDDDEAPLSLLASRVQESKESQPAPKSPAPKRSLLQSVSTVEYYSTKPPSFNLYSNSWESWRHLSQTLGKSPRPVDKELSAKLIGALNEETALVDVEIESKSNQDKKVKAAEEKKRNAERMEPVKRSERVALATIMAEEQRKRREEEAEQDAAKKLTRRVAALENMGIRYKRRLEKAIKELQEEEDE